MSPREQNISTGAINVLGTNSQRKHLLNLTSNKEIGFCNSGKSSKDLVGFTAHRKILFQYYIQYCADFHQLTQITGIR